MTKYSVKQLSELAGVSVRTLHHYDQIGLLVPSERTESKYRYYQRHELVKLQQILFYKELGFPLSQIQELLEDPEYDLESALEFQRAQLVLRAGNLKQLIQTIDKTLNELKTGKKMKDEEMYAGFSKEETAQIRKEVKEKWGEQELEKSENRVRNMSKDKWALVMQQGEQVGKEMASLVGSDPGGAKVQKIVQLHFDWVSNFYDVPKERYLGLSELYAADERFTSFYDKYGKGTAELLSKGMRIFAEENL